MSNLIKRVYYKFKIIIQNVFSSENAWLYRNRLERMDANRNDIFEFSRASFHLDRYKFASKFSKDKIVLDAACGTGYGSKLLSFEGNARIVIGLDIDFTTTIYAQQNYSNHNTIFVNATIAKLPFQEETFDLVVSFETIEHVVQETEMLSEFKRVLKKNGRLILSTPNDWGLGKLAPFHVKSYDLVQVKEILLRYFKINQIYNQNSGTKDRQENHNQPRGIVATNEKNFYLAECYIFVAEKII